MFLCYLIDPGTRSVTKVRDGFDRAPELTDCDEPQLAPLWQDSSEPDSTVDIAWSPDAADGPAFRLTLTYAGQTLEQVIAGKGVLIACGAVPDELAGQIATTGAVTRALYFFTGATSGAAKWLKDRAPAERAPARRARILERHPRRKAGAAPGGRH